MEIGMSKVLERCLSKTSCQTGNAINRRASIGVTGSEHLRVRKVHTEYA